MNFGRATAHFVFSFQNYSSTSVPNICNNSRFRLRQEAMFFRVIVFSTKCNSFEFQNVFCKCFTDLLFFYFENTFVFYPSDFHQKLLTKLKKRCLHDSVDFYCSIPLLLTQFCESKVYNKQLVEISSKPFSCFTP